MWQYHRGFLLEGFPYNGYSHIFLYFLTKDIPKMQKEMQTPISILQQQMFSGEIQMFSGEIQFFFSGEIQMFSGEIQICSGEIQMFSGEIQMFSGEIQMFSGEIQMFSGKILKILKMFSGEILKILKMFSGEILKILKIVFVSYVTRLEQNHFESISNAGNRSIEYTYWTHISHWMHILRQTQIRDKLCLKTTAPENFFPFQPVVNMVFL